EEGLTRERLRPTRCVIDGHHSACGQRGQAAAVAAEAQAKELRAVWFNCVNDLACRGIPDGQGAPIVSRHDPPALAGAERHDKGFLGVPTGVEDLLPGVRVPDLQLTRLAFRELGTP